MIEIYIKDNLNFEKNGDITLDPSSCIYSTEINGEKGIVLEHDIDEIGRWKYIKNDNIISVFNSKKKFYRIYNTIKSLDGIRAFALPVFYDLINYTLIDVRPTNKTGQEALDIILNNTPFRGHSNIKDNSTAYYVRKNILESLVSNDENSFFNRWGGEIYVDNWDIYINDKIGTDKGVKIEFGHNILGVEEDENHSDIATRIIPVGADGLMLEGNTPWVDSPLINKYSNIKSRVVSFEDVKVKENQEDEEGFNTIAEARLELVKRANEAFKNGIDKPVVNYKIDLELLENTEEYKRFKDLLTINEGDTVTCYIHHLDINVKARCIKLERDEIEDKVLNVELGDFKENFIKQQSDIKNRLDNILNSSGNVNSAKLEGIINAVNTKFRAQRDIAQKQEIRAMLFEDKVKGSVTYGALCLGTMGFQIANKRNSQDTDWQWDTAATGSGIIADWLVGRLCTVLITNADGSIQLDLNSTDGIKFKKNGYRSLDINGNQLNFYDWEGSQRETPVGTVFSGRRAVNDSVDPNKAGLIISHMDNAYLTLSYYDRVKDTFYSYIDFDKDKILTKELSEELNLAEIVKNSTAPILIRENVDVASVMNFLNYANFKYGIYFGENNQNSLYAYPTGETCIKTKNGFRVIAENGPTVFNVNDNEFYLADSSGKIYMWKNKNSKTVFIDGDLQISGEVKGQIKNFEGEVIYPAGGGNAEQKKIVDSSRKLIGLPYVFGGNYPPLGSSGGTDCSGLIQWAFNDNGIKISRTTYTQINEGIEVSMSDLQPGDLVFTRFENGQPEHVVLYSKFEGGKHYCVEAPRTGLNIRERELVIGAGYRARRLLSKTRDDKYLELEERIKRLERLLEEKDGVNR